MVQSAGVNMNTWVVGHTPVGHFTFNFPRPRLVRDRGLEEVGEKTFFMKARIMAGQVSLGSNELGLTDFQWLCKEEVEKQVQPRYWSAVKDMLAER